MSSGKTLPPTTSSRRTTIQDSCMVECRSSKRRKRGVGRTETGSRLDLIGLQCTLSRTPTLGRCCRPHRPRFSISHKDIQATEVIWGILMEENIYVNSRFVHP
ncbi:hypothetical protein M758_3G267100 [Ceratodon purpureus]|uniref:Uncharacterized protein n=1 Tax=Ceratodon purpureus TaxID=3225 RepID=A0A8T0IN70_CERPU|nr:hypothetical protein KC19_3G266900 [Ceratodon purpureus]KAG0624680.1 hypothetical protein M758_3G267100 [Ceratodon purpureus]